VKIGIGAASLAEIHRLNIYHASHVAMLRALRQIGEYDWVLVDGRRILDPAFAPGRHTEIVRGDAKSFSIAAASIVAKVTRDRLMHRLDALYPAYGFAQHVGYITPGHSAVVRALGPSAVHRLSFQALCYEEAAPDAAGVRCSSGRESASPTTLPAIA
jgi:ribonuclease HII